ncbi:MAG: NAD-dependent epimerase/dehydratase family protein, partial [Myxococcota bacterium]|nr:NAD-dependent epimerase/dehydratase family protein [Myxococcota bacterium]
MSGCQTGLALVFERAYTGDDGGESVEPMRIFITGATGFIGRALVQRLRGASHEVVAWVRDVHGARMALGDELTFMATDAPDEALSEALDGCGAVVNLAGRPVIGRRWTRAYRRAMVESRVHLTRRLMGA